MWPKPVVPSFTGGGCADYMPSGGRAQPWGSSLTMPDAALSPLGQGPASTTMGEQLYPASGSIMEAHAWARRKRHQPLCTTTMECTGGQRLRTMRELWQWSV